MLFGSTGEQNRSAVERAIAVGHPGFTAFVQAQCRSLANSSNWSSFNVKFFIMNFFGK